MSGLSFKDDFMYSKQYKETIKQKENNQIDHNMPFIVNVPVNFSAIKNIFIQKCNFNVSTASKKKCLLSLLIINDC